MGNERGEVLVSVLTESEGMEGLRPITIGLIWLDCYRFSGQMQEVQTKLSFGPVH